MDSNIRKISFNEHPKLLKLLDDTPDNAQAHYFLSASGLGSAYINGDINDPEAFLIASKYIEGEPKAYGDNPKAILEILKVFKEWEAVLVKASMARPLGELVAEEFSCGIRYFGDIVYSLTRPVAVFENENVRLLTADDAALLKQLLDDLQKASFHVPDNLLTEGIAAGAIIDGRLVSIAYVTTSTQKYADIATFTDEKFRKRGFSTAASSLVCKKLQDRGLTPVWSTGEDTIGSQKIAKKLGFEEFGRNTYVIRLEEENK